MRDVVFLLLTVGFFAVAALLVVGCDRILGPDPVASPDDADGERSPEAAAV